MPRLGLSLSTAIIALAVAAPGSARADGFHGGHGHVFFHSGFHSGVFFGFGGFGAPFFPFAPFPAFAPWPVWGPPPSPWGWGWPPPSPWGWPPPAPGFAPSPWGGTAPSPPPGSAPPPGAPQPLAPPPPATSVPPAAQQVWYYCPPTQRIYPQVASCAVAWQAIPTTPPGASPAPAPLVAQAAPPPQAQQQPPTPGSQTALQAFLRELREDEQHQQPRVIAHYKNAAGQDCEAFEQPITIDGQQQRASGTVCQRADGRWMIAPGPPPIHASRPQPQG